MQQDNGKLYRWNFTKNGLLSCHCKCEKQIQEFIHFLMWQADVTQFKTRNSEYFIRNCILDFTLYIKRFWCMNVVNKLIRDIAFTLSVIES